MSALIPVTPKSANFRISAAKACAFLLTALSEPLHSHTPASTTCSGSDRVLRLTVHNFPESVARELSSKVREPVVQRFIVDHQVGWPPPRLVPLQSMR